ncbi:ABC transporter permease [Sporolactobacillus sp. Y61]|uniref:Transport permease protein n=1 Tax=Sporolactobacillus sp. Y61 TaxID=3160863 RepID=A0AAU8IJ69_9BACL
MSPSSQQAKKATWLVTNLVFVKRSIRHSLRDTEALIMAIVLPIMLMLMFTYVFGGAIDPGGDYVTYVVPGIILLCAGFGSSSTAVDVAGDMASGIIDRFRTLPIRSVAVINGHVVASVVRNSLATAVVFAIALLVGFRPSAHFYEWLGAIGIILLFILTITWLFAAIGLLTSSPTAASGYGFALLFLPYLSSAFVPTNTMPEWLRVIADNQPITPIIETIRGLLTNTPIDGSAWWAIGWCILFLGIALLLSGWAFQRKSGRR